MLESGAAAERLDRVAGGLACGIRLPTSWDDYFGQKGLLPVIAQDRRRFARFHYRRRAILECVRSLPALPRAEFCCCVYAKDISRNGIAFLHCQELFPAEEMRLRLPDRVYRIRIVRCLKRIESCFEIGALFEQGDTRPASGIAGA